MSESDSNGDRPPHTEQDDQGGSTRVGIANVQIIIPIQTNQSSGLQRGGVLYSELDTREDRPESE